MTTYNGKCHCGSSEWRVILNDNQKHHIMCHCQTCKILSGGAFTLNQAIPKLNLTITKGDPACYTYYGDSGKPVHCYYCPLCTTHIYHHQEAMGPDTIVARTGLLVEAKKTFEVGAEIFGKDKWKWEKQITETFRELPPT